MARNGLGGKLASVDFVVGGQLKDRLRLLAKAIVTAVGDTSSWDADQQSLLNNNSV